MREIPAAKNVRLPWLGFSISSFSVSPGRLASPLVRMAAALLLLLTLCSPTTSEAFTPAPAPATVASNSEPTPTPSPSAEPTPSPSPAPSAAPHVHGRAMPPEVSFVDNVVGDASFEGTGPSLSHLVPDATWTGTAFLTTAAPDEVRSGLRAVKVTGTAQAGGNVTQTLQFAESGGAWPTEVRIRGCSKPIDVVPAPGCNPAGCDEYSIAVDAEFVGGSSLTGAVVQFDPTAASYHCRSVTVVSSHGIQQITLKAVFDNVAGAAVFDDFDATVTAPQCFGRLSFCHGVRTDWGEPTPAPTTAPTVLPESQWWDLDRNRQAVQQTSVPPHCPDFDMAFKWQAGDQEQDDWLPQGITGLRRDTSPQRNFIVVSWYGKKDNEKKDAVRLSFVDLADLTYRHVILVVPDGDGSIQPLRCHAGGIAAVGHKIYVVDTLFGIREFDALAIWPAVASSSGTFSATNTEIMAYNYRYVMPQTRSWELPGGPRFSYISRVWTTDGSLELLSGSFERDGSTPTMLARWILGEDGLLTVKGQLIQANCRSVQGAMIRRNGTTETLFLSRSWGQTRYNMYSVDLPSGYDGSLLRGFEHHDWPARAEDMFLSRTDRIWSLTETKTSDRPDICPRIVFQSRV